MPYNLDHRTAGLGLRSGPLWGRVPPSPGPGQIKRLSPLRGGLENHEHQR